MRLDGKVALITGGASGIGRASALLFAREGARVAVIDVLEDEGLETVESVRREGGLATFIQADVSKAAEVAQMVAATLEAYGALHVLFNNAGVDHPDARSITETTEELWNHTIGVNLTGVFLCSKYGIPAIRQSGGGVVINTASIAGLVGTREEAAYCASKGGVVLLTKQMAIDYAADQVRVNCICPGAMGVPARDRRSRLDDSARARRQAASADRNPLGRLGTCEDVAYAALYLASDESRFVTGAALTVDGGYTAL